MSAYPPHGIDPLNRTKCPVQRVNSKWLEKAANPREGSASRRLIASLPAKPNVRTSDVIEMTGASASAASRALNELEQAGVLKQITVGRRNRAWEAVGLLELADEFERSLATPDPGDGKPSGLPRLPATRSGR